MKKNKSSNRQNKKNKKFSVTVDDARKILGKEADKLSDEEIHKMINGFRLVATIVLNENVGKNMKNN